MAQNSLESAVCLCGRSVSALCSVLIINMMDCNPNIFLNHRLVAGFSGKCNPAFTPGSVIFKVDMIPEEMQGYLRHFHTCDR